jgi:hypothetical protein
MLDGMGRDEMRAADGDRQAVADKLRAALDEGRLDLHEYDERLQRAYGAKTYGELDGLLTDLPTTVPEQRSRVVPFMGDPMASEASGAPAARYPDATRRWLVETWDSYFLTVAITTAIWLISGLASGDMPFYWPVWVAGPWGAVLLAQTLSGLGRGEPQRWAEKQDRKRLDKQVKKQAKLERQELGEGASPSGDDDRPAS